MMTSLLYHSVTTIHQMNKMIRRILSAILAVMILSSACSTNKSTRVNNTIEEMEETEIIPLPENFVKLPYEEANGNFAFKLFGQVNECASPENNIIISPLSIAYALSMTLNGASESTEQAMLRALELYGYTKDEVNMAIDNISKILFDKDKGVDITLANSIWSRDDIQINDKFEAILKQFYNAESRQFKARDKKTVSLVNNWIADKTDKMITNMLDNVDDNIIMMLVNAICFKGKWAYPFDEEMTTDEPFFLTANKQTTAKMMNITRKFDYFNGEGYSMVELPYGDGDFVIDIFLPDKENDINMFLSTFGIDEFTNAVQNKTNENIKLSLPRFKYEYKKELKDILSDMGMAVAFGNNANFSGISPNMQLAIGEVTHKAFIETTEEGTKAAAATVVGIKLMSARPIEPITFIVDRPFFYTIREIESGTTVFMGKVVNPEWQYQILS